MSILHLIDDTRTSMHDWFMVFSTPESYSASGVYLLSF